MRLNKQRPCFFLKKKLHCIFKDPICLRENFCSNREYLVSKQVLHSDKKKTTSNIQKGEKILESLFTFYLSSADFSSIWQIYSDKKKL